MFSVGCQTLFEVAAGTRPDTRGQEKGKRLEQARAN